MYQQQQHQHHQQQQQQSQSSSLTITHHQTYPQSTNPSSLQYPYYPPYDNQVDFYQAATLRLDPQGVNKKIKSCSVCQLPVHVLLISKPCLHYFCYQCYQDSKIQCGYCGSLNTEIIRVNDYDQVFTCQGHCYKVFESQNQLKNHLLKMESLKVKKN